jgi:hypothetical protein
LDANEEHLTTRGDRGLLPFATMLIGSASVNGSDQAALASGRVAARISNSPLVPTPLKKNNSRPSWRVVFPPSHGAAEVAAS